MLRLNILRIQFGCRRSVLLQWCGILRVYDTKPWTWLYKHRCNQIDTRFSIRLSLFQRHSLRNMEHGENVGYEIGLPNCQPGGHRCSSSSFSFCTNIDIVKYLQFHILHNYSLACLNIATTRLVYMLGKLFRLPKM